jgi:hypothetical protein
LFVTLFYFYFGTILGSHNFFTNHIGCQILFCIGVSTRCVKVSLLEFSFLLFLFLPKFFLDLCFDFPFNQLVLATDSWNVICGVSTGAPDYWRGVSCWILDGTINAVRCVVELLLGVDRVFEIKMTFWNVLFRDGPTIKLIWNWQKIDSNSGEWHSQVVLG